MPHCETLRGNGICVLLDWLGPAVLKHLPCSQYKYITFFNIVGLGFNVYLSSNWTRYMYFVQLVSLSSMNKFSFFLSHYVPIRTLKKKNNKYVYVNIFFPSTNVIHYNTFRPLHIFYHFYD